MTTRVAPPSRAAPAWRPTSRSVAALAVAAVGAAAGLLSLAPWPVVALVVAAPLAAVAAALWPGVVALTLIVAVLLQDWLVAAGLPAAQMADEVLLVIGLSGVALRALASHRFDRTPLDLPIVGLVAVGAAAAFARGVPPLVAALGLMAVLKGLLAFELLARIPVSRRSAERGVVVVLTLVAALATIGALQWFGGAPAHRLTGRAAYYAVWQGTKAPSLMTNHNALGHVCVLGGLLALGLVLTYRGVWRRRLAIAAGLCLAGLIVSASRESWVGAAGAVLVGAWVTRSRRLLRVALATVAILAVGTVVVYFGSPFLREEIARRGAGVAAGWHTYRMGYDDWSYRGEYRVYVILKSWEVFRDHMWLGTGPGRFGGQAALTYLSPLYEQYGFLPLRGEYLPLDVFWSRLLAEFGLLGTVCYGAALVAAARIHLAARRSADRLTRGLALGGGMALVAVLVLGLFAPALEDPLVAVTFWAWTGLVWSLAQAERRAGEGEGTCES